VNGALVRDREQRNRKTASAGDHDHVMAVTGFEDCFDNFVTLILELHPQSSHAGIAITIVALVAIAVLAWLNREEARRLWNAAFAADAAQSAICAHFALITLFGLSIGAVVDFAWVDAATGWAPRDFQRTATGLVTAAAPGPASFTACTSKV